MRMGEINVGVGRYSGSLQEGGVRGGWKCVPSAIGCGSKCLIMRLIVPLLCLRYKYTPVGPEGDSLNSPAPLDRLIIRLNTNLKRTRKTRLWNNLKAKNQETIKSSSAQAFRVSLLDLFFSFFLLRPRWILTLAPPAAAPPPQTWWWMIQLGPSSPTRCSRHTAKRTEQTARPARAGWIAAVVVVRPRPGLSSAKKRYKTWDWK